MSLTHRPYVGHEVVCDARGCNATTATAAPPRYRRSPATAAAAANGLGWVEVLIGGIPKWACPLHQTFDERLGRWVATPLFSRDRKR